MTVHPRRPTFPVLFLCLLTLLAGCGKGPRTLRVATGGWAETTDPLLTEDLTAYLIARQLYESPLRLDSNDEPGPNLAVAWEYDQSRTRLTLSLRTDVLFHSGDRLNASVVARSLRRAAGMATGGVEATSGYPHLYGWPASIEAVDDSTLLVALPGPHEPLLRTLSSPLLAPVMLLEDDESPTEDPCPGTGPFQFAHRSPDGSRLVLDRFDDYWGTQPAADRVVFEDYGDSEQAYQALQRGDVDLNIAVSAGDFHRAALDTNMALVLGNKDAFFVVGINNAREPLDQIEARRAILLALDRSDIVEGLYRGAAEPTDRFAGESILPAIQTPALPVRNTAEAARIVESRFPPDRRVLRLIIPPSSSSERQHWLSDRIRAQLREVGLDVEPLHSEDAAEFTSLLDSGEWDLSFDGAATDTGDPFDVLYVLYGEPRTGSRYGLFHLPRGPLVDLFDQVRAEGDPAFREEVYSKILHYLREELPCVPLGDRSFFVLRASTVAPFELEQGLFPPLRGIWKRDWSDG